MITNEEKQLAREALRLALAKGAQHARITLSKSSEDLVATLNGEVDRVTRCEDRSMNFALFVDGRFGSFSTNKLDPGALDRFLDDAVEMVRMLAPDAFRKLPDPARTAKDALTGQELGLYDPAYEHMTPALRRQSALAASAWPGPADRDWKLISEEGEYADSLFDSWLIDSNGLECRHTETSFDYGVEVTVQAADGLKYSGYWWDASPVRERFDAPACGVMALRQAVGRIGAQPVPSGRYNMVVSTEAASRMVSPILAALNAYSIQQHNSFLADSLDRKVFHEGMNLVDTPHIPGQSGSRLYDSEGLATCDREIIREGTVKTWFINTYMGGKMGMDPTVEEASRPRLLGWPRPGLKQDDLMALCGDGILITGFNGGNCDSATGDFSYGIEGYRFRDGRSVGPVGEMLVTGNFITLWQNLIAVGDDARPCMSKLIPTLAFSNVDFSG